MGYYIDPEDGQEKGMWLQANGIRLAASPETHCTEIDGVSHHAVCLVDNIWMTAAGIMYDPAELSAFKEHDGRPKYWYMVPTELLKPYCSRL